MKTFVSNGFAWLENGYRLSMSRRRRGHETLTNRTTTARTFNCTSRTTQPRFSSNGTRITQHGFNLTRPNSTSPLADIRAHSASFDINRLHSTKFDTKFFLRENPFPNTVDQTKSNQIRPNQTESNHDFWRFKVLQPATRSYHFPQSPFPPVFTFFHLSPKFFHRFPVNQPSTFNPQPPASTAS